MFFRKRFFKQPKKYSPPTLAVDISASSVGNPKNGMSDMHKPVQVLKTCNTVKHGECIGQRVHYYGEGQKIYPDIGSRSRKEFWPNESCALKKAKLACSSKSPTQIFKERKGTMFKNFQPDHPAFRSSLFMGSQHKNELKNRRTQKFGKLPLIKPLQSIKESEEEHS